MRGWMILARVQHDNNTAEQMERDKDWAVQYNRRRTGIVRFSSYFQRNSNNTIERKIVTRNKQLYLGRSNIHLVCKPRRNSSTNYQSIFGKQGCKILALDHMPYKKNR